MKKRVLSMLMALALCLTLLPASAWAAEDTQEPDSGTTEDYVVQVTKTASEGTGTETKYYNNLPDAFDAANSSTFTDSDGSISKVEVKLLKNGATYDLNELNFLQLGSYPAYPLGFEYTNDVKVIIDLNGCTLKRTVTDSTHGILLVEQGDVTVKNGTLELDDSGSVNPAQAIDMPMNGENPTLTLENMTITVADIPEDSPRGDQGYAIDAKGGMLDLQGNTLLYGGLTMTGDAQLKNKLTAGKFINSGSATFSVNVIGSNYYNTVFDLLATDYVFAEYNNDDGSTGAVIPKDSGITAEMAHESVVVIKCTHTNENNESLLKNGTCTRCGFTCAHETIENGICTVCKQQMKAKTIASDGAEKYYLNLQDAFAGVADGGTVTMLKSLTGDNMISFCKDTNKETVDKTVTLMMNGKSLSFEGASPLYVESGKLIIGDDAAISQPAQAPVPAVWVDNNDQGKDRGTLEFQGKATITGGLLIQNWGKLVGGLKEGTIITSNGTYSVSVERSETYSNVLGLLGDGLAFAKKDHPDELVNGNVKKLTEDVIVVAHTHSIEEGQSACACGKQFEASVTAEGGVSYYDTIDSAFAAAHEGDTVTLLADITNRGGRGIFVSGGPYTLDLNGHRIEAGIDLMVGDMDGSGVLLRGELTVKDSSTNNAGYVQSLKLWNGDLTVESGSFRWIVESGSDSVGTITITGGTADEVKHTSAGVTFRLSGGTFKYVENIVSGKPGDLLADNRAFFNRDNNFVNGYDDRYQAVSDVVVKEHTHNIVDGSCACGFTCAHDWSDKNGVCKKANCGYHCPHNAGATEAGGVWACNTCGQTVTAKVVAPGGTTTYYADGRLDNGNVKSGLYFAIKAAKTGSTVAALGGEYSGGYVTGNKTLTLDVSNGKPIDGILYVGEKEDSGNKLIVRGSTEISYVIVAPGNDTLDNTLDLTGWTGRIGSLTVLNGGKATLNGGTFAMLNVNGATAGSLLAEGYAFQNADNGAYVEYSSTANMENVKVVKCPHSGVTLKGDHTGAECKYCGASFAATLDDAPYGTIDAAVTDWLENGGTLKLYADYTATDGTWRIGSGSHTVDLNGHMMSVKGDGAFKPTNNMHLTVTDDTERGQITNILLDGSQRGSFTLESGIVGNLGMTGGAVVALKGGSVDNLDVQNCSANTNLSIQGGSLGKLNIKDWDEGMHVSATGGSLGAYTLPSGKILADVLDHQYYAEGTSLDRYVDTAQRTEKFVIKQAPHDFGSASKAANVPINGSIPFRVDSPSENVGLYEVKWYRRTNSGAEHMVENKVADVNVGDKLDVFCVITGVDSPGGAMQWQVAVKGYTIKVVPAKLSGDTTEIVITNKDTLVYDGKPLTADVKVTYNDKELTPGTDYTVSGNTGTDAKTYTLTITGKGNYGGEQSKDWTIKPRALGYPEITALTRKYDGTTALPGDFTLSKFKILPDDGNGTTMTLTQGKDFMLDGNYGNASVGENKAFTITITLRDNYHNGSGGNEMTLIQKDYTGLNASITKADAPKNAAGSVAVMNKHANDYEFDLAKLLPTLEAPREYGAVTYGAPTVNLSSGYYTDGARVEDGKLILPIRAVETKETGSIGSVKVKVSTTNYHDFTLTINVNAINKIVPTGDPTLSAKTLTYGQALSAIKLSGTMKGGDKTVPGTFAWADGTVKPEVGSGTYEAAWKFTPTDGDTYTEADGTVSITVNKAKLTGAPTYTRITAANKTLADANLKPNPSWPTGTIQWVDKDGKELENTTEVKANTAYEWIFTPTGADAGNYTTATGELTLYSVSTGGGSSSGSTVKTDTVTNPDGSVTKTETKSDGTVVETTTGKDGSTTKTETKKDGSSVTETKAADGSIGTVKTDKHGQTTAETALSSKAIETAKRNGEPVTAPVEVEATRDSDTAPTVKIELPKNSGDTKVEIPVTNVKPGTVAVLVHPDGTEEIIKNSLPTEDGIQLTVNGDATVKVMDNSKNFTDTAGHWSEKNIDFVSARGLLNGTSANTFSPNAPTTRAQLWTVLARQADADLTGGANWYEKAQAWSTANGISDGSDPNAAISRAQVVTMLWRAMGQPAAGGNASFADVPADSYYAQAVAWAIENGITAGVGGGRFDPAATCTRAQIAAFLARSMK